MRHFFFCFVIAFSVLSAGPVSGQDLPADLFGDGKDGLPPALRKALEQKAAAEQKGGDDSEDGDRPKAESKQKGKSKTKDEEKKDGISKEDQKTLDDFFEEMEKIVEGEGKRAATIATMKEEFQAEYRENELGLKDDPDNRELQDRQKLIAQHYMDLSTRSVESDPRKMQERLQKVSTRIRDFRKAHPKLSRLKEFRDREREIRSVAMQRNGGFGGGFPFPHMGTNMRSTMELLSASGVAHDIWAPKVTRAHPGESKGALQKHAFTMRRLMRLRWSGEQLALDKNHWENAFAGQTLQQITADVDHMLEERGVSSISSNEEQRNRARMMNMQGRGVGPSASNLGRIFNELTAHGSGYSGGRGASEWTTNGEGFSAALKTDDGSFRLRFSENSFPSRTVMVRSTDQSIRIVVLGDFIHRFSQVVDDNGPQVRVTEILNDEIVNYKAKTFGELYRKQTRFVEDRFFPLLEHIGVVPPLSRFDEPVVLRVCELLRGDREKMKERFDAIAVNLDVDEFTKRDQAYRELRANVDEFFPFIFEASKDESLSIETRARIGKLLEIGSKNGTAELDSMIVAMGLTSDSKYLAELIDIAPADARPILKGQIDSLK